MSDLTDFLLARIAEDEQVAKTATPGPWTAQAGTQVMPPPPWTEQPWWANAVADTRRSGGDSEHIARHDPARVLADCEAKRRIIKRCSAVDVGMPSTHLAQGIIAEMATAYADHPEYREEWKP